jgi:hypothetical protein
MAESPKPSDAEESPAAEQGSGTTALKAISPLFRLPAEIRREIWKLCLTFDDPFAYPQANAGDLHPKTALLRTSRLINREATPFLYRCNTLLFKHPSDCNIFTYCQKRELAQEVRSILFHIEANDDVQTLWTGYFSSTYEYRSLKADYPKLEHVHIVLASNRTLRDSELTPLLGFQSWKYDTRLKSICRSLIERSLDGVNINILFLKLSANEVEMQQVLHAKEARDAGLDLEKADADLPQLRTRPTTFHGLKTFRVVLDGTVPHLLADNPWLTEKMFTM